MSDQDFFFDEDDKKPAAKPAAKSAAKSSTKPAAKKSAGTTKTASEPAPTAVSSIDAQTVSMSIAILLAVIGVLVGVIVGLFIGKGMATPAIAATTPGATGTSVQAPQLSQDQINAGELPAGHPSLGGTNGSAPATPTK